MQISQGQAKLPTTVINRVYIDKDPHLLLQVIVVAEMYFRIKWAEYSDWLNFDKRLVFDWKNIVTEIVV